MSGVSAADASAEAIGGAVGILLVGVVIFCALALRGLAVALLWTWFGVPLGLPSISIAHGVGLALLGVAILGNQRAANKGDEGWKSTAMLFVGPAFLIAVGYLVKELFL